MPKRSRAGASVHSGHHAPKHPGTGKPSTPGNGITDVPDAGSLRHPDTQIRPCGRGALLPFLGCKLCYCTYGAAMPCRTHNNQLATEPCALRDGFGTAGGKKLATRFFSRPRPNHTNNQKQECHAQTRKPVQRHRRLRHCRRLDGLAERVLLREGYVLPHRPQTPLAENPAL